MIAYPMTNKCNHKLRYVMRKQSLVNLDHAAYARLELRVKGYLHKTIQRAMAIHLNMN